MTNPVQNALNEMHQQWVTDEAELAKLAAYSNEVANLEYSLHMDTAQIKSDEASLADLPANKDAAYKAAALNASIAGLESKTANLHAAISGTHGIDQDITNIENTFTKDNGGVSLIAVLNGMIGVGTTVSVLCDNKAYATKYLTALFAALSENLQMNLESQLMQNKAVENNTSASEAAAQQMIHDGSVEQNDLSQFNNMLLGDFTHFNNQYIQAGKDYSSYNPMNFIKIIFGDQVENMNRDKKTETNAAAMEKEITTIMTSLAPAMAQVSSMSFMEIQTILQHIMHKLEDILDDPSSKSLQSKLNKVLGLVMFALGLFGLIEQSQESAKTRYEKEMAEANMDVTKMNMTNQQVNQQIVAEEVKNEAAMKIVSLVATIAVGLVSALMGGIGTAIVMTALTILQLPVDHGKSVMSKLTKDIATAIQKDGHSKETAKIWADVIVTVIEIVIAFGGGAMLDAAISRFAVKEAVARAVDAAMNRAKDDIEDAATQAATSVAISYGAGPEATALLIAATKEDMMIAAKKAAEIAARRTLTQFWRQSVLSIKGGLKQLPKLTEEAAENAAKNTAKSADKMAQDIANSGYFPQPILPVSGMRMALIEEVAVSAAGKDGTGFFARAACGRLIKRTLLSAAFGIGNTSLPMDIATAIADKHHKKVDNGAMITMEVIQAILQMIAMIGAMSSGIPLTQAPSMAIRGSMAVQGAAQAASGAASFQQAEMLDVQANAELRLQMTNALAELLHTTLTEMQEALTTSQKAWVDQEKTESQLMNQLAIHLYDGENAGTRVLTELAG